MVLNEAAFLFRPQTLRDDTGHEHGRVISRDGVFSSETSDDAEKFLAEPEQAERCRTCSQELVTHARKEEYTQTNHHRMRHNNRIN